MSVGKLRGMVLLGEGERKGLGGGGSRGKGLDIRKGEALVYTQDQHVEMAGDRPGEGVGAGCNWK